MTGGKPIAELKLWQDFRRQPIEPWPWWFRRHELKLFLLAFTVALIL